MSLNYHNCLREIRASAGFCRGDLDESFATNVADLINSVVFCRIVNRDNYPACRRYALDVSRRNAGIASGNASAIIIGMFQFPCPVIRAGKGGPLCAYKDEDQGGIESFKVHLQCSKSTAILTDN